MFTNSVPTPGELTSIVLERVEKKEKIVAGEDVTGEKGGVAG